jgi:hypothetical protein
MEVSVRDHEIAADPDAMESGTAGTGQENEELKWGRRHIAWDRPEPPESPHRKSARLVDRVTALHDIGPAPGQELQKKTQKQKLPGRPVISCDDDAAHCSQARELSDRQEKIAEALLVMINDLQYRVDALEYSRRSAAPAKSGMRPGERP